MTIADIVAFLGGPFGRPIASDMDLATEVTRGLPRAALHRVVQQLRSDALTTRAIYALVGARAASRRSTGRLSSEVSARLARLARMAVRAGEALGSPDKACRWLAKPSRALDGQRPLDLLASDAGTRAVEDALGRMEHGVTA